MKEIPKNAEVDGDCFTQYYYDFVRSNSATPHGMCLREFLNLIVHTYVDNIQCVLLFGGLVRDGAPILGWSDIDILVIFKDLMTRDPRELANILLKLEERYGTRIDLSQADVYELSDKRRLRACK